MIAVILDGGHGFETEGKRSTDGSLRENEFNDAIVNKLSYALAQKEIPYKMVSAEWSDTPLSVRTKRENLFREEFVKLGYDPVFISIHANAAENGVANGYETFIFTGGSEETEMLGKIIHENALAAYRKHSETDIDRGLKEANFYVLKHTKSPAVLIECGFMTNAKDLELLKSDAFRNDLTNSLIKGIEEYDIYSRERNSENYA